MKVISIKKLKRLIEGAYKLKPSKIKKLRLGTINLSYLIETRDRNFVFRIYQRNNNKNQIEVEHILITFLKERNYPVAGLIRTIDNETLGFENSLYFALFDFIPGKHLSRVNLMQLKSAAKFLGRYHFLIKEFNPPTKKEWWHVESISLEKYLERIKIINPSPPYLSFLEYQINNFASNTNLTELKKLPHLFIHGDFSLRNLKFIREKISGVFDFDNVRKELRIFDFVRPLQSMVGIGKCINKKRIQIFFSTYILGSKMPPSALEYRYLVEMFRIQHLKEALWQLEQYTISKELTHFKCLKREIKFLKWLDNNYNTLKKVFLSL